MFHHDGPFDAAAPSRNRNKSKAPMYAFGDQEGDFPFAGDSNDKRLTPLAQATRAAMAQSPGSPYSAAAYPMNESYNAPKKSPKKNTLAEAWGIADPEPFEEFFAGVPVTAESGTASANSSVKGESTSRSKKSHKETREPVEARRTRTQLPPPKPIALPGASSSSSPTSPTFDTGDLQNALPARPGPTRTKSLIQRIKKMRDNPNVPLNAPAEIREADEYDDGRFGSKGGSRSGTGGGNATTTLPSIDSRTPDDQFVVVEAEAPTPPAKDTPISPQREYFDRLPLPTTAATPTSPGLGRKQSMMKKIKGVVAGGGKAR
jgi:hypothetical protein